MSRRLPPWRCRASAWMSAIVLAMTLGCDSAKTERVRRPVFRVLLVGTRNEDLTWQAVLAGAQRFTRDSSTMEIRAQLPAGATPVAQSAVLERVEPGQGLHAICVLALDAGVLGGQIRRLTAAGISVVLIGDDSSQTGRLAFLGADEKAVGVLIARTLAAACTEHRTLMLVHDNRGGDRLLRRYEGFTREVASNAELKVIREFDCRGDATKALQTVAQTSERFPDLGGWALLDDWLASAASTDRPLLKGHAKIVGYCADPSNLRLLEDGRVYGLVTIDWEMLGYQAIQTCRQSLNRSAFPVTDVHAQPVVITRENVDEYRRKLQYPKPASSSPAPAASTHAAR